MYTTVPTLSQFFGNAVGNAGLALGAFVGMGVAMGSPALSQNFAETAFAGAILGSAAAECAFRAAGYYKASRSVSDLVFKTAAHTAIAGLGAVAYCQLTLQ